MRAFVFPACSVGVVVCHDISNGTACAAVAAQCGGTKYNGTTCCTEGNMCKAGGWPYYDPPNPAYEHCVPECAASGDQCGGQHWRGVTCCASGSTCAAQNDYFSSCAADPAPTAGPAPTELPEDFGGDFGPSPVSLVGEIVTPVQVASDDCAAAGAQCGGVNYNGTTCCSEGNMCKPGSWPYYTPSQPQYEHCIPEGATAGGQCGGEYWRGVTGCPTNYTCTAQNEYFSSCVATAAFSAVQLDEEECVAPDAQCGGFANKYNGTSCCTEGNMCKPGGWPTYNPPNPAYEHCIPECAAAGGQCGGRFYSGVACCASGSTCTAQNNFYSSCVSDSAPADSTTEQPTLADSTTEQPSRGPFLPIQLDDKECVAESGQCGGTTYNGTTCCAEGLMCKAGGWPRYDPPNPAYEHCIPECAAAGGQCGGRFYSGVTCCASGSTCTAQNAYYSSCLSDSAPADSTTEQPTLADLTMEQPTLADSTTEQPTQEMLTERAATHGLAGASMLPIAVAVVLATGFMLGAAVLCKRTSEVQEDHDAYQSFLSA